MDSDLYSDHDSTDGTDTYLTETCIKNKDEISKEKVPGPKKWICTFHIMGLPENSIQHNTNALFSVTDMESIRNIDDWLVKFFEKYNTVGKSLRSSKKEVIEVLGTKYTHDRENNITTGIVVLQTETTSPQFNRHLHIDNSKPVISPTAYGLWQKTFLGHAHSLALDDDLHRRQGYSTPLLFDNWVDAEFYANIHWIIPPSSTMMEGSEDVDETMMDGSEEVDERIKEEYIDLIETLERGFEQANSPQPTEQE